MRRLRTSTWPVSEPTATAEQLARTQRQEHCGRRGQREGGWRQLAEESSRVREGGGRVARCTLNRPP